MESVAEPARPRSVAGANAPLRTTPQGNVPQGTAPLGAAPQGTAFHNGDDVLQRLVSAWKEAWSKLGLSNAATVMDVANCLEIDRGTAQRLNRIAKISDTRMAGVGQFPGVRAWQRVLVGTENLLGVRHPSHRSLLVACEDFSKWIGQMGGSRSSAVRQMDPATLANAQPSGPNPLTSADSTRDPRAIWVESAIQAFGYSVDTRVDLQVTRTSPSESPSDGSPIRLDIASVHILKGCRGNLGALPITFSRAAYANNRTEVQSSADGNTRTFHTLKSVTSRPAPVILTTVDSKRQTIYVEPNWTSLAQPLDLGIMHEENEAMISPWGIEGGGSLESATVNRHPNRRLVMERFVSRQIDRNCTATVRAFRTQMILNQVEPWFDRIPDQTQVERIGTIDQAKAVEIFSGYAAALDEVASLLNWDWEDLIVYRADIANPIPLATYTIKFDSVRR